MDFLRALEVAGDSPWLAPWWQLLDLTQLTAPAFATPGAVAQQLNAWRERLLATQGAPGGLTDVAFEPSAESLSALEYERRVGAGQIPTRDCLHDWYNGLVWLLYPQTRLAINRLHVSDALDARSGNGRSPQRNALTLFDENGAILLSTRARLPNCLAEHDWQGLFIEHRGRWWRDSALVLVGHGLLESLHRPYKGLCAKVLPLVVLPEQLPQSFAQLDALLADTLPVLTAPSQLRPLPVMGVPGWFGANEAQGFYADRAVFREKPTRR